MSAEERAAIVAELQAAGRDLDAAIEARLAAGARLAEVLRRALASGMSEVEAARTAGVSRTTARRAVGKPY